MADKAIKPILIFSYGNPSRGDDALGLAFTEHFAQAIKNTELENKVELLTDFQLQIEHVTDLQNRQKVIFVDACENCEAPFSFNKITAQRDNSYTTHALQPQALLQVYQQVYTDPIPDSYVLAIKGFEFELGKEISTATQQNMLQSSVFLQCIAYKL